MAEKVAIILAAGVSSRMKTELPKVLHEVCGRPMLSYVLDACREVEIKKIYVIVGYGADMVEQRFADATEVTWVRQDEQLGTAHAVLCCKEHLKDFDGETLVVCGDMPLVRGEVLKKLIEKHESSDSAATLATAILDEPKGYGRILRDECGNIQSIVEESDCSQQQREIKEVNPSYYIFDNKVLFETLEKVKPNNAQNEYYLTDALELMITSGHKVKAVTAVCQEEAIGVNNRFDLSQAEKIMQQRIQNKLVEKGVTEEQK